MLEKIPIRYRLALAFSIGMTGIFLLLGILLYKVVETKLYDSVDVALLASARSIRDARFGNDSSTPIMQQILDNILNDGIVRPYAQLVDFSGRISARSDNIKIILPVTALALTRAEQGLYTFEIINTADLPLIRQLTLPVYKMGRFTNELVQVASSLSTVQRSMKEVLVLLWIALPLALILSVLFGYYITRISLYPVTKISLAAAQLSADDLKLRLPVPPAKDELQRLTLTFNGMMGRLEDSFSRLRRFAGDVSHELRTPLSVMRGEAELALRRERTTDEYRRALEVISKESVGMSSIVEDLLLLARAQSGSLALHLEKIATCQFLSKILFSFEQEAKSKDIHIHFENNLPSDHQIRASANFLEIAIKNLIRNAIKHSPTQQQIILKAFIERSEVKVSVTDHGLGIPPDALPFIFDPFFRVDDARNKKLGGVGLGLSLTKALISLQNGRVDVSSVEGKGSVFTIILRES